MSTLGDLNAHDLGKTLSIQDGGATYRGQLAKVDHSSGYGSREGRTFISIKQGGWGHMAAYPSSTPCEIEAGAMP